MDETADPPQFETFYAERYHLVRDYAARRFGEDEADDIAQETMIRAFANLASFGDRPVMPWLRTVATRVGIDGKRRRRPQSMEAEQLARLAPGVPDHSDAVAMRVDVGGLLQRAMRRLTARDRQALTLHEVHGVGIGEIAALTGVSAGTVRQRLFRARHNLGRYYRELGGSQYLLHPVVAYRTRTLPRPVQHALDAAQRSAAHPAGRMANHPDTALAAVVTGAVLVLAPPPPVPVDRPPAPAMEVTVPLRAPELRTPLDVPGLRPVREALDRVPSIALSRPGAASLPFAESWENGLGGWTVEGRSAGTDCQKGYESSCSLRLDGDDAVAVSHRVEAPLAGLTFLELALADVTVATGARYGAELDLGTTVVRVTVTADDGGTGPTTPAPAGPVDVGASEPRDLKVVVGSSTTSEVTEVALGPTSGWRRLVVVLDSLTSTVAVEGSTDLLMVGAPLLRVRSLTLRAEGPPGGAARAWVDEVAMVAAPACSNGLDDDGDGRSDLLDPDCTAAGDATEAPEPTCSDGADNDGDGATDFPRDPECASARGSEEPTRAPACSDGVDNDGDGTTDYEDDASCADPKEDSEVAACRDGADNDGDGRTDYPADPGCDGPEDDQERKCPVKGNVGHGPNECVEVPRKPDLARLDPRRPQRGWDPPPSRIAAATTVAAA